MYNMTGMGKEYKRRGFRVKGISKPEMYFTRNMKRYDKDQISKDMLKYYDEDISYEDNMFANKYYRIWDCGCV